MENPLVVDAESLNNISSTGRTIVKRVVEDDDDNFFDEN